MKAPEDGSEFEEECLDSQVRDRRFPRMLTSVFFTDFQSPEFWESKFWNLVYTNFCAPQAKIFIIYTLLTTNHERFGTFLGDFRVKISQIFSRWHALPEINCRPSESPWADRVNYYDPFPVGNSPLYSQETPRKSHPWNRILSTGDDRYFGARFPRF